MGTGVRGDRRHHLPRQGHPTWSPSWPSARPTTAPPGSTPATCPASPSPTSPPSRADLSNGNVPYYCIHKTLAGLLDVWRHIGSTQARDVLLALAGWVDWRTGRLSSQQMQAMLGTEFGGMNAVLTDLYQQTGDARWLTVAQRFDHAAVFNPLASNQDQLNGLHANTQVPKWIGAAREYKATGTTRYRDIAANAWNITRQRAHVRDRRQQPGRALPGPERHRRLPDQRHLRELQHLQHAQADPGAVAAEPRPGRLLRLLRAGAAQPHDRPAEPGRRPRARHLLHPAQPRRPARCGPGVGRRHLEHRLQHASGAARAPAWRSTPS